MKKKLIILNVVGLIIYSGQSFPQGNWQQQVSNIREDLNGISFIGDDRLCIVGDNFTILKSSDQGQTWRPIRFVPGGCDQNTIYHSSNIYF